MAKHVLDTNLNHGWEIEGNNGTWTVTDEGAIVSTADGLHETAVGIYEDDALSQNDIEVDGSIIAVGGVTVGIYARGEGTHIDLGQSAEIAAFYGIVTEQQQADVFNAGSINCVGYGISALGGSDIVNAGRITAQFGIMLDGAESSLVNKQGGVILGQFAVHATGAETRIVNNGLMAGAEYAVVDEAGSTNFINRGKIVGIVDLGGGDDRFSDMGGRVTSYVGGGNGDDTYRIHGSHTLAFEQPDEGHDRLFTSVDYSVGEGGSIEEIRATGKKNISLDGSGESQTMAGNGGDNSIDGEAGADILQGRGGNDRLTGGADGDTFDFRLGCGKDVITDFEQGTDLIQLDSYGDLTFGDLAGRISDQAAGMVIKLDGGDRILLEGVHGITLTIDDFLI